MSNHRIECQLDLVINLLESLPDRMCEALDKRQELLKAMQVERVKADIEFYSNNRREINKMMFGYTDPDIENKDV